MLWLSYQRYSLILFAWIFAWSAVVTYTAYTFSGWLMIAALPALWVARFAIDIGLQYPRKRKLTQQAQAAIEDNTFHPDSLRNYCADPCYRVVANHILTLARYSPPERRAIITAHRNALQQARESVVVIDYSTTSTDNPSAPLDPNMPLPTRATVRFLPVNNDNNNTETE